MWQMTKFNPTLHAAGRQARRGSGTALNLRIACWVTPLIRNGPSISGRRCYILRQHGLKYANTHR